LLDEAKVQMRAAKENGAVAVCMRPLEGEHLITDPYFYPLMEEAQKLDLSMAIHIANGNAASVDLYGSVPAAHPAAGFGIFRAPTVTACMFLVLSDIHELFPKLRWGIIEAAAQWIPWVHREATRRSERDGRALPEDLFGGKNIFVTCQSDEDIPWILKYAGKNCLMIGTDYGHNDTSSDLNMINMLRARDDISEQDKEQILSHNPKALYGLGSAA
jgi:predicted TIM-barrel fold metal-dependent hydrolase